MGSDHPCGAATPPDPVVVDVSVVGRCGMFQAAPGISSSMKTVAWRLHHAPHTGSACEPVPLPCCSYLGSVVEDGGGLAAVPASHHNLLQGLALQVSAGNLLVHVVDIGTVVLACVCMQAAAERGGSEEAVGGLWPVLCQSDLASSGWRIGAVPCILSPYTPLNACLGLRCGLCGEVAGDDLELTPVEFQGLLGHVGLQSVERIWRVLQGDGCAHHDGPAAHRGARRWPGHDRRLCELEGHGCWQVAVSGLNYTQDAC